MTEPYIHPSLGRRRKALRRTPLKRTAMKQKAPKDPGIPKHTREFVLRRDGGCRGVGVHEHECWGGLHIHHILPRSRGGLHHNGNLVVVCSTMHFWIHNHPLLSKEMGFLR